MTHLACAALIVTLASVLPTATPPAMAQDTRRSEALVDLVNPLIGNDSTHELSYGNTYLMVAVAWGMSRADR